MLWLTVYVPSFHKLFSEHSVESGVTGREGYVRHQLRDPVLISQLTPSRLKRPRHPFMSEIERICHPLAPSTLRPIAACPRAHVRPLTPHKSILASSCARRMARCGGELAAFGSCFLLSVWATRVFN